MDATALTASVKELNEASAGGKTEVSFIDVGLADEQDIIRLLKKLKADVEPTEELLRVSRLSRVIASDYAAVLLNELTSDLSCRYRRR